MLTELFASKERLTLLYEILYSDESPKEREAHGSIFVRDQKVNKIHSKDIGND